MCSSCISLPVLPFITHSSSDYQSDKEPIANHNYCDKFYGIIINTKSNDKAACPSEIECGTDKELCWNNMCVLKIGGSCPEYIPCPSHIPFKCPNGECRGSFSDCPQPISCPYEESSGKVEFKLRGEI